MMKLPKFLMVDPLYIKEQKITNKNAREVFKPLNYFIYDTEGVRYSGYRYYVDENNAIRIRNWAKSVDIWVQRNKPKANEISQMIHKVLKPIGYLREI